MPALNFSKIYCRQAKRWKINHSLNKPFQESAPDGSHLIGCLLSKSTVFIMLPMALTFPLSLFSPLTFIPLLIESTFHSGAHNSFVRMRMFPILGRGIANGPSLVDQKERGAPSTGLSHSNPLAEMLLPPGHFFSCYPCALLLP